MLNKKRNFLNTVKQCLQCGQLSNFRNFIQTLPSPYRINRISERSINKIIKTLFNGVLFNKLKVLFAHTTIFCLVAVCAISLQSCDAIKRRYESNLADTKQGNSQGNKQKPQGKRTRPVYNKMILSRVQTKSGDVEKDYYVVDKDLTNAYSDIYYSRVIGKKAPKYTEKESNNDNDNTNKDVNPVIASSTLAEPEMVTDSSAETEEATSDENEITEEVTPVKPVVKSIPPVRSSQVTLKTKTLETKVATEPTTNLMESKPITSKSIDIRPASIFPIKNDKNNSRESEKDQSEYNEDENFEEETDINENNQPSRIIVAKKASKIATATISTTSNSGGYVVRLGSLRSMSEAEQLAKSLGGVAGNLNIKEITIKNKKFFRVVTAPTTKRNAQITLDKFINFGHYDAFVSEE